MQAYSPQPNVLVFYRRIHIDYIRRIEREDHSRSTILFSASRRQEGSRIWLAHSFLLQERQGWQHSTRITGFTNILRRVCPRDIRQRSLCSIYARVSLVFWTGELVHLCGDGRGMFWCRKRDSHAIKYWIVGTIALPCFTACCAVILHVACRAPNSKRPRKSSFKAWNALSDSSIMSYCDRKHLRYMALLDYLLDSFFNACCR